MVGGRCFAATAYSSPTQRQPARALMLWQTTCYRAPCNREKRNRIVKTKVIVLMLLAVGAVFAQLSVGVRIGAPPPVRALRVQPRSPGTGYTMGSGLLVPRGQTLYVARGILDPSGVRRSTLGGAS